MTSSFVRGMLLAIPISACTAAAWAQATQGLLLYEQRCASCHTTPSPDSRAPNYEALRQRTPEAILEAITNGSMRANAEGLSDVQKRALAEHLTGRPIGAVRAGAASTMKNHCQATAFDSSRGP